MEKKHLHKHLYFHLGIAISQQREDKTQHSIDVPLRRLQIENRRWKTPTKLPPSSSKLGSADRCLAGHKKWSTRLHILFRNVEAGLDPLETCGIEGGRAQQKRGVLAGVSIFFSPKIGVFSKTQYLGFEFFLRTQM